MPTSAHVHARLRLLAEDAEDLAIISAALQDALSRVGDIDYRPAARTLTVAFNRICWERADVPQVERVRVGLQLGAVLRVQARNIGFDNKDGVLALLAMSFEPTNAPGGAVMLHFAGGGDLRAEVECIDAVLADLSDSWRCKATPSHEIASVAPPART